MEHYVIGDRNFTQQSLVWGQVKQLRSLMGQVAWPTDLDATSFLDILGEYFPMFAAIILKEEGTLLKEKDVEQLAKEFESELDLQTSVKVINDFFECNPIDSLFSGLSGVLMKMSQTMDMTNMNLTLSTKSAVPLPEEISPSTTE